MTRVALALAVFVAAAMGCGESGQRAAQQEMTDTTHMMDNSGMMSDTAHMMAGDTAHQM